LGQKEKNNTYLQNAVEKADAVIPAFPMGSYEDLFKLENRFKEERIWEVNFNASLSQGWKGNQFLVRLLPKMNTEKEDLTMPRDGLPPLTTYTIFLNRTINAVT